MPERGRAPLPKRHLVLVRGEEDLVGCAHHIAGCGVHVVKHLPLARALVCSLPHEGVISTLGSHPAIEHIEEDAQVYATGSAARPASRPPESAGSRGGRPGAEKAVKDREAEPVTARDRLLLGLLLVWLASAAGAGRPWSEGARRPERRRRLAPAADLPWGIRRIRAPDAWTYSRGRSVRVAVLDTGVDLHHPNLRPNLRAGVNVLSPGLPPQDDNGHGTHVAGIIAAAAGAGRVVGVAPEAELYPVKALDAQGAGYVSDLIEGLQWCVEHGMQVVNLSLGTQTGSVAFRRAVEAASRQGLLLVAAAGNDGPEGEVDFPARYPETVAVAALTPDDSIAPFSSRGPEVDVAAPGQGILSTYLGGGYKELDGTSMAAPHVAGAAALWLSLPTSRRAPGDFRSLLQQASVALPGIPREAQGAGVVDAARLLDSAAR